MIKSSQFAAACAAGLTLLTSSARAQTCFEVEDAYESNNSCAEAVKLCEGFYGNLVVGKASVVFSDDFWRIKVEPGQTVTMDVLFRHVDGDIDISTWTRTGCNLIEISQSVTDDEQLTWTNTSTVTDSVLLRVYVWQGSNFDCNDYDLVITGSDPTCGGVNVCSPGVPNSTGLSGRMQVTSDNVAGNVITFTADQLPPGRSAFFFAATTLTSIPMAGGSQGTLCAVNNSSRFLGQSGSTTALGLFSADLDTSMMQTTPISSVAAGETWIFQCWHRDMNPGNVSNFTDALQITFE